MTLKKIVGKLHLWLGMLSGLVVLIIGLTGAIYCFAPELQDMQSYRWVTPQNKPFLPPSEIDLVARKAVPGKSPQRIYYDAADKAVMVLFSKKEEYSYSVFIDPYNGKTLKVRNNNKDFLSVVLQLHRTLLIPYGHEIIRWSTVIFIIMLISGMVLWWPRKRRHLQQGFRIMWRASPKRLNYDLHKVLGFYISWIAIFTALSGLMFAFEGFGDFVYRKTGSAQSIIQKKAPLSDSAVVDKASAVDQVWQQMAPHLNHEYASLMFVLPNVKHGAILVRANPERGVLYKTDFRYFDQYSGKEIAGAYVWGSYKDVSTLSDNIRRMNYDIHTGAIFGLPGRIVLFFVALIVASLPVTGFYFWWGRQRKRKRAAIT
jgi:uncharacterized iron-regulated membrane protein